MSLHRSRLQHARRRVVKIGSALLTDNGQGLDQAAMAAWVAQMVALKARGIELILVSSCCGRGHGAHGAYPAS